MKIKNMKDKTKVYWITEWFAPEIDPIRKGVYQTRTDPDEDGLWFQYWNGREWKATGMSIDKAFKNRHKDAESYAWVEWCGLSEQPK